MRPSNFSRVRSWLRRAITHVTSRRPDRRDVCLATGNGTCTDPGRPREITGGLGRFVKDMRAFAVDEFGQPGSIHDLPVPEPGDGQVRVRIDAASINPFDNFALKGYMKDRMEHHFPLIPCSDLAGRVDAVGPGVTDFAEGDLVFGITGIMAPGRGTLAEFANATAGTIAPRPAGLGAVEAAALPLAGVSAVMCVDAAAPHAGDVIVVIGASGGIGGYAVQLAAMRGAHVVAVTGSDHVDYVKSLGAAEVVDRNKEDVRDALRGRYPDGVDAIIDTASDAPTLAMLGEAVRAGGVIISMRGSAAVEELQKRDIRGVNVRTQVTTERLAELGSMVIKGKLKPGLIHTFKLDQAGEALELVGRSAGGKVVITI